MASRLSRGLKSANGSMMLPLNLGNDKLGRVAEAFAAAFACARCCSRFFLFFFLRSWSTPKYSSSSGVMGVYAESALRAYSCFVHVYSTELVGLMHTLGRGLSAMDLTSTLS